MSIHILILAAIIIAITLGYVTRINIGLYAIAFAYLTGVCVLGLRVNAIIAMWPVRLFFILFSISMFYGFATINGTLENLALKTIFACRKVQFLLPAAIFVISLVLSAIGAGAYAVIALMAPLTMAICKHTEMSRLLGSIAVCCGSVAGATLPISVTGLVAKGLIERAGYPEQADAYVMKLFLQVFLAQTLIFVLGYFGLRGFKIKPTQLETPPSLNNQQKNNLILLGIVVLLIVVPPLTNLIVPGIPLIKMFIASTDITMLAILGSIAAILLKIGDERKVIAKVPWNTIILLCGMGMLIEIAVKAGTINILATFIGNNVSYSMAPVVIILVAAFMSFFSSSTGVVMPTLYPVIPGIAAAVSRDPAFLFAAVTIGASCTGFSPFSSGGGLLLSGVEEEKHRDELFSQLLVLPFVFTGYVIILTMVGVLR
ncbi:MAG: SLC13 family permease [Synergistaceae bacterium]|jgi:di/tricarboxylate transporter|nr:SLC13 family permease [Synergistaceae bacterium]